MSNEFQDMPSMNRGLGEFEETRLEQTESDSSWFPTIRKSLFGPEYSNVSPVESFDDVELKSGCCRCSDCNGPDTIGDCFWTSHRVALRSFTPEDKPKWRWW
eukprot:m.82085 g.82085  ORF g.82085 m.82085 type:complete len:102 (-) comp25484_c1_seq3:27-332(-)